MTDNHNRAVSAISLCLLYILLGCTQKESGVGISNPISPTPLASNTVSETPDITITPTNSLPAPTHTLASSTTIEKAEDRVIELLLNNAGCMLPCWWGLIPGEDEFDSIESFFIPFSEIINRKDSTEHGLVIELETKKYGIRIPQYYREKKGLLDLIWLGLRTVTNEENSLESIQKYSEIFQSFTISEILTRFGQPDEVLLFALNNVPEKDALEHAFFSILVLYKKRGMIIEYEGIRGKDNNNLTLCPSNSQISLWLLQPNTNIILRESLLDNPLYPVDLTTYLSLFEATGSDKNSFYMTFKEKNNSMCIVTPSDLWP